MKSILLALGLLISGHLFAQKIEVLNFATFHMSYTPDAHAVKFDQKDNKSKQETFEIAKMLAEFKPTVICVEVLPGKNDELNIDYNNFLKDNNYKVKFGGEIALLAYEAGKLAGVKRIYGIDEQETAAYNYNIGRELENQVDSLTSKHYTESLLKEFAQLEKLSILNKLKFFNKKESLENFININADILTYNSTQGNFEGADEASKFYRRNLRMFSNLNQVPLTKEDRVLVILGATHTAFLTEFMKRSPKYELKDVAEYLK
ncbi:hypothetical protein E2P86_13500 [Sphingobacterium psychroaquaticum]|uniref:DUF5694 domain-containing protein n=1 Tax=Sphingobacterium psychroaquaticum TaxID=561061 RepID=UPI00106ACD7D|nr:DUF5694 domain-containing protein [Sphingobacterium psychroaquaticum]QBQ42111.1 hypothetical protein E2P86_13500 [Sphingobacterium psychroaquaticum]